MKKHNKSKFLSMVLTLAVIATVIISGPVQAITLGFTGLPTSDVDEGDEVTFQALVDIYEGEYIRADTNVTLNLSDGITDYVCTFALDGTRISDSCEYTVELASESVDFTDVNGTQMNYLYGYGYGYSSGLTLTNETNFSVAPGYGYASGYGYGVRTTQLDGSAEFVYDITWTTASGDAGTYYVNMYVMVNDGTNQVKYLNTDSKEGSFTVVAEETGGNGGDDDNNNNNGGGIDYTDGDDDDDDDTTTPPVAKRRVIAQEDVGKLQAANMLQLMFGGERFAPGLEKQITFGSDSPRAGQTHKATLKDIHYSASPADRYVVVTLESEPQEVTVYEGQSVAVDITDDGEYDVLVTADEIGEDYALLSMSEISVEAGKALAEGKDVADIVGSTDAGDTDDGVVDTGDDGVVDTNDDDMPEDKGGMPVWLIILIVVVVIAVVAYFLMQPKKK